MRKNWKSNLMARVLAILLAVILWLFVTGDKITRTTPTRRVWQGVPLQVENLHQDYVVTDIPNSVDITLEGLPEDFEDLPIDEIGAYVDLSSKESGNHLMRVHGRPPRGLSLVLLEPDQVRVSIEAYYSEDFELEIEFVGEPAEGWELAEYIVLPAEVLIGAPESVFERVFRVVLVIDLTGMRLVDSVELMPQAYDEEERRIVHEALVIDPNLITVRLEFDRVPEPDLPDNDSGNG